MSTPFIDFLTRNQVLIEAPPSAIWPHIVDTNAWFGSQAILVSGRADAVGAQFTAGAHEQPDVVSLHIENAEMAPQQRRTIRVWQPDGLHLGYSTWVLEQRGAQTAVSYEVYCRYTAPEGVAARDLLDLGERAMDASFKTLKTLVEGSR